MGNSRLLTRVGSLGLGVLAAVGGFVDFGGIVTSTQAGAQFRFALVWTLIIGVVGFSILCRDVSPDRHIDQPRHVRCYPGPARCPAGLDTAGVHHDLSSYDALRRAGRHGFGCGIRDADLIPRLDSGHGSPAADNHLVRGLRTSQ